MAGVTSNYPASIDSESNIIPPNNGDTLTVPGHWLAGNNGPIVNVQNELGTDPSGSFSTVKARLDDIDDRTITEIDSWHLTANASAATSGSLSSNWSRFGTLFSEKGAGLTESSGIFQFPSTGYYKIVVNFYIYGTAAAGAYSGGSIRYSTDNFASVDETIKEGYFNSHASSSYGNVALDLVLKITDTSNQKIRFGWSSVVSCVVRGSTSKAFTGFTSIKIGEL